MVDTTTPTQVAHPGRTVVRSIVQALPLIGVLIGAIVETVKDVSPGWIVGWGPAAASLSLILVRVMALESTQSILALVGLSAAPKGQHEA